MKDYASFFGFFIGGDYSTDLFSAGLAFMGTPVGENANLHKPGDAGMGFMLNVHGKVFLMDMLTIGLNFALYGQPLNFYPNSGFFWDYSAMPTFNYSGEDAMMLEAMLSLGVALDMGNIGLTFAMLGNAGAYDDTKNPEGGYMDMKLGLSFSLDLGGGFTLTPGFRVIIPASGPDGESRDDKGSMDLGLTFTYAF